MQHELHLPDTTSFLNLLSVLREQNEIEMPDMVASAFQSITANWDFKVGREALDQMFANAAVRVSKGGRVLDAGCGTGLRIPEIRHHFEPTSIVGVDRSASSLNRARESRHGAFFAKGDIGDMPFDDETFDVVVSTWVVETVEDPKSAIEECLRVLKSGGILAYCFVNLPPQFQAGETLTASALTSLEKVTREQELPGNREFDYSDSDFSLTKRYHKGLISTVLLGKCCEVKPYMLPVGCLL
ncbi:MAG: class I SAM-dependent methyltransferase [Opitutales bacterium]